MNSTGQLAGTVTGKAVGGGAGSTPKRRRAGKRRASGVAPAATTAATQRGGDGPWTYEARRSLKVGDDVYLPGDIVPAKLVESWPRPEAFIRTGKLIRRPKFAE